MKTRPQLTRAIKKIDHRIARLLDSYVGFDRVNAGVYIRKRNKLYAQRERLIHELAHCTD